MAYRDALDRIFAPRTAAVIGASDSPGVGRTVLNNLPGCPTLDWVVPVNPKRETVGGLPAVMIDKGRDCYVPDGIAQKPGFVYGTHLLHEAMRGGYSYPPIKENQPEKEEPNKDGYYDHSMNAIEYIAINAFPSSDESGNVPSSFDNMMDESRGGW
jgi:hypothetical protein